mmetsp:Transcript_121364/g.259115  ORF Transcript_121364/g.259115 Transcript_121364/m.259115 type:complete len:170 (+) Transcript_121364:133-642(+)
MRQFPSSRGVHHVILLSLSLLPCVVGGPRASRPIRLIAAQARHRRALADNRVTAATAGTVGNATNTITELDPRYHFLCVHRPVPGFLQRFGARHADAGAEDTSYHDLCILGFRKLSWAFVATGVAMVVVLLCIPMLLSISRRRPPGQPICTPCCQAKRSLQQPTVAFVY